MARFVPPGPSRSDRRRSRLHRILGGRRSALSLMLIGNLRQRVGRWRAPALPFAERRWLYLVRDPALVRRILVEDAAKFPKSPNMQPLLGDLINDGIFVSNGETWERQRRLLDPAFGPGRLKAAFPLMLAAVEDLLQRLDAQVGKMAGEVAVDLETTWVTADIIFRTILSTPLTEALALRFFTAFQTFQRLAYRHGLLRLVGCPEALMPGRRRARRAATEMRALLAEAVRPHFERCRAGEAPQADDILAAMMTAVDPVTGKGFAFEELLDQVTTLFFAGHEESATGLAWALYLLAMAPEAQERVHREVVEALGERRPAFADLRRLPFTRDVFREALRLYPPVSYIGRSPAGDVELAGKPVPAGTILFLPLWLMQRHEQVWEAPDAFDPDRYRREAGKEAARQAHLPFSAGPRVCLGASFAMQEATLVLALLMRRYRFLPVPGHVPRPVAKLTLRSENGIRLKLERR